MRNPLLSLLMATFLVPVAAIPASASAQSRHDVREARQDLRKEQRDLQRAYHSGDRKEIRKAQKDVKEAKRDYNKEVNQYQRNKSSKVSNWNAPFRYQRWNKGAKMSSGYYAPRYAINNPQRYRLPNASRNLRWVRHYDDAILVNSRTGKVMDVRRNVFR